MPEANQAGRRRSAEPQSQTLSQGSQKRLQVGDAVTRRANNNAQGGTQAGMLLTLPSGKPEKYRLDYTARLPRFPYQGPENPQRASLIFASIGMNKGFGETLACFGSTKLDRRLGTRLVLQR